MSGLEVEQRVKPKTRAAYASLLRSRILPTFGKAQLARVRPIDVRERVADMQAGGLSPSRIRQAAHVLSAVMEAAWTTNASHPTPPSA